MPVSIIKNNRGVELIITILLMTMILFLSTYLLDAALIENRIAISQSWGAKTYYLAEAGVQDMVWKLKNDAAYKQNFETDASWTASFTRTNPFGAGSGSYTVTITNSAPAHGEITSSGSINVNNNSTSQRIVQATIYKAMSNSFLPNVAGYGDHDLNITNSLANYNNGGIYANHDIDINGISTVNIQGDLNAVHNFTKDPLCTVNASSTHSSEQPPAPSQVNMPAIDINSNASTSLKSIADAADAVYSTSQFSDLLKNNQNLTLDNKITYVDGDADIIGAQNLTVNGLLVIKHDFTVGDKLCLDSRCGPNNLTVNNVAGNPSGIIVGHKIDFENSTANVNITGLLYSSQDLLINSLPVGQNFNITGDIISGHNLQINSVFRTINITKDDDVTTEIFGAAELSPIVNVEHWEEEY